MGGDFNIVGSKFIAIYKSNKFLNVKFLHKFPQGWFHYNKNGASFFNINEKDILVKFHSSSKLLGFKHRPIIKGPAFIAFDRNKRIICDEMYYVNGKLHNTVAPAYRRYSYTWNKWENIFFVNGNAVSRGNFFKINKII